MDNDHAPKERKTSSARRWPKRIGYGCLTAVIAILGLSAASNLFFPDHSNPVDRLSDLEKARITEAFRLRRKIGDSIWPGLSSAEIPIIVYNEAYVFLTGIDNPDPGWHTVPHNIACGGQWDVVPNDLIDGSKYYRQRLPDECASPQAFTVRVGNLWAASMTTKDWMPVKMGNGIRNSLLPAVNAIVPYRLIARIFLGLGMNTDGYICAIEHESFHAYQGMISADRLAGAEMLLVNLYGSYPRTDPRFNSDWKAELNVLADALAAKEEKRMVELANEFIALRKNRRKAFHLDPDLEGLERLREWEEGLGKYTELATWKSAASDPVYKHVQNLNADPDFEGYRSFDGKWAEEMITLRLQSRGDDNRFYYSGMAQAFLLDRLQTDWKTRILQNDAFLENLLEEALAGRK